MERIDLLEVIRARLIEAGIERVFPSLPDMGKFPDACVLTFGAPSEQTGYFDMTFATPIRVTCLVSRRLDVDAWSDAVKAERAIRTKSLDSSNGSYTVESVDTSKPQPVQWDESGRYVYAFDSTVTINIKEF